MFITYLLSLKVVEQGMQKVFLKEACNSKDFIAFVCTFPISFILKLRCDG
jgi:hypothetical protein